MQHPEVDEDFLQFESKVDEVMKLLNEVSTETKNFNEDSLPTEKEVKDYKVSLKSRDVVDEENFIVTVRDDRTLINKRPDTNTTDQKKGVLSSGSSSSSSVAKPNEFASMDKFTFMEQIAKDSDERAKVRQERERVAQNFRNLGNEDFRKGNYEKAILLYTKAIEQIKDSPILYCNRALSYIKLQNYKRAIIDCDYVLNKLDEKHMRAWLYRAASYKLMHDEQNYETCVKFVRKYNSKQLKVIDDFLAKIPIIYK